MDFVLLGAFSYFIEQRATTNTTEATERTRSKHRRGSVSEASDQREVVAKCERTIELPQNAGSGAPRADASGGPPRRKVGMAIGTKDGAILFSLGDLPPRQRPQVGTVIVMKIDDWHAKGRGR